MQQVVCDGEDCGAVIGAGEEFVEVSALLLKGRPPAVEGLGSKTMQLCVACVPKLVVPRRDEQPRPPAPPGPLGL